MVPRPVLHGFQVIIHLNTVTTHKVNAVIIVTPILQMWKLRHWEFKLLTQDYRGSK